MVSSSYYAITFYALTPLSSIISQNRFILTLTLLVLINNAAIACIPSPDLSDFRTAYNTTFNTNITSTALVMTIFLPLLSTSPDPRIVNISSVRGSLTLSTAGKLPATAAIAYSLSKMALNALTIEFAKMKEWEKVLFQCVCPGHCKTDLNGFKGKKDPLEGAKVVVELVGCERGKFPAGFWHMEEGDKAPVGVPW